MQWLVDSEFVKTCHEQVISLDNFDFGALKWLNFQLRWSTIDHSDIEQENVNFYTWQISALASNEASLVEWLQFAVVVVQKNLAR